MIEFDPILAEKLENTGLSKKEAAVYTALILTGGAYPSKIAEITKLNRTTIYTVLDTLAVRGLVTELEKRNKLFYQAENPKSLERYAKTRITQANRALEHAQNVLPTLEGLFSNVINKPLVRFHESTEGVLRVYEDHVKGDMPYEMLGFSNAGELTKQLDPKFREKYISKKAQIGITSRGIFPDTEADVNYAETVYARVEKKFWPKARHIPAKDFPFNAEITIYGKNKVSIINFTDGTFAATIIEDQTIHGMMKMIFELAWKGAEGK